MFYVNDLYILTVNFVPTTKEMGSKEHESTYLKDDFMKQEPLYNKIIIRNLVKYPLTRVGGGRRRSRELRYTTSFIHKCLESRETD